MNDILQITHMLWALYLHMNCYNIGWLKSTHMLWALCIHIHGHNVVGHVFTHELLQHKVTIDYTYSVSHECVWALWFKYRVTNYRLNIYCETNICKHVLLQHWVTIYRLHICVRSMCVCWFVCFILLPFPTVFQSYRRVVS
jgi:hypothetical protein